MNFECPLILVEQHLAGIGRVANCSSSTATIVMSPGQSCGFGGGLVPEIDERRKWDAYYDSLPLHAEDEATRRFNSEFAERISALLEPQSKVLEAGCGGGWQSEPSISQSADSKPWTEFRARNRIAA